MLIDLLFKFLRRFWPALITRYENECKEADLASARVVTRDKMGEYRLGASDVKVVGSRIEAERERLAQEERDRAQVEQGEKLRQGASETVAEYRARQEITNELSANATRH